MLYQIDGFAGLRGRTRDVHWDFGEMRVQAAKAFIGMGFVASRMTSHPSANPDGIPHAVSTIRRLARAL